MPRSRPPTASFRAPTTPETTARPPERPQRGHLETSTDGPAVGFGGDKGEDEDEEIHAPLTEDAAVVLGIAATAIPFARSVDAQAEQWLRALSRSGDTGIALKVFGAHDVEPDAMRDDLEPDAETAWSVDADVVTAVTRQASQLAVHHDRPIQTDDLLEAVAKLYGRVFDRVLARHGVDREELLKALSQDSAD